MYTTPLGNIIRNLSLDFHVYADDTQLYVSFKLRHSISRQTAISQVEACIKDIITWMTNNLSKLNYDKTELIIITTNETTSHQENIVINIGDSPIAPSVDHITPVLKDLHWLPVEHRINYKILLLAYKAQHGNPTNLGGLYDLRVNICWRLLVIAWMVLASVALRMPPLPSGTRSPSPSSVPSQLTLSRVVWRHICLMSHIHNATRHFCHIVCVFPQLLSGVCLIL